MTRGWEFHIGTYPKEGQLQGKWWRLRSPTYRPIESDVIQCFFNDAIPLWSTSTQDLETVQSHLVFSWEGVSCGVFGANETTCLFIYFIFIIMLCNGPLKNHIMSFGMFCRIMVGLSGSRLFRIWKKPRTLLTKMSLTNLIRSRRVKGLIMTHNNSMVLWKVRPKMGNIS